MPPLSYQKSFLLGLLLFCSLAVLTHSRRRNKVSGRLPKNRQLLGYCPDLHYALCHGFNYTSIHTTFSEDVVKATSAKFFLDDFGCGPGLLLSPSNYKSLLKMACGKKWLKNSRVIGRLLCDQAAVWAGSKMIQKCTINGSKFWGNDECFDTLEDVWKTEERSIFCSTLDVDRSKDEYKRIRDEMKCLGYYPATKRRPEICEYVGDEERTTLNEIHNKI